MRELATLKNVARDLEGLAVDRSSPMPAYAQIRDHLLPLIRERKHSGETSFFTDDDLSGHFRVSKMTARQALASLVQDGLLLRKKGVGTSIAPQKVIEKGSPVGDFFEDWATGGQKVRVEVRIFRRAPAGEMSSVLAVPSKMKVLYFCRRRLVDSVPVAIDERWVAPPFGDYIQREELRRQSIHVILADKVDLRVDRAKVEIEAVRCIPEEAELLKIAAEDPVLVRTVTMFSVTRQPLWTGRSVYRADRYKYSAMVSAQ